MYIFYWKVQLYKYLNFSLHVGNMIYIYTIISLVLGMDSINLSITFKHVTNLILLDINGLICNRKASRSASSRYIDDILLSVHAALYIISIYFTEVSIWITCAYIGRYTYMDMSKHYLHSQHRTYLYTTYIGNFKSSILAHVW